MNHEFAASVRPAPVSSANRIHSIDVLRGLVLLGILIMNLPFFALPHWAGDNPVATGPLDGLDWWSWFGSTVLVDGKARALFSMLFGAGVVLLTANAENAGAEGRAESADIYYRRMLWLMVFGLIDGYLLLWPGDIIYAYGLVGLILYPLRKLSPRTLFIAALIWLALGVGARAFQREHRLDTYHQVVAIRADIAAGKEVSKEQKEKLEGWDKKLKEFKPDPADVQKEIDARRGGYLSNLFAIAPITKKFASEPLYLDFDIAPIMLIGLGLARSGIILGRRSTGLYLALALVCTPLGLLVASLRPLAWSRTNFDPEFFASYAQGSAWSYSAQRVLLAIGYLSIVMLASRLAALGPLLRPIAAAGRMPLTNYLTQSVIGAILFTGVGFGLFAKVSRAEFIPLALAIWLAQVIFSVLWLRKFAFGPLEWLWRYLAYRRKPAWLYEPEAPARAPLPPN